MPLNNPCCCCGYSFKIIDAYNRRKERTAKVRATEMSKAATQRKQQNKEHMANIRATEPVEVAAQRKQQHREHMANARATEPVEVATERKQQNREHKANARAIVVWPRLFVAREVARKSLGTLLFNPLH